MKKILSVFAAVLAAGFLVAGNRAEAVPAFARQMRMSCKGCHFQYFPKLNAFGRAFKAHGFTDVAVDTIEGDWGTSLPVNLNLAYVAKIQFVKTIPGNAPSGRSTGTDRGELLIPDEAVFWIGGRVAEHVGAVIEVADGAWTNGKIVFGVEVESLEAHLGLTVWGAENAGPFWGEEFFNTGLIRGARNWENREATQADDVLFRSIGQNAGNKGWEGVTGYVQHEWFFAAYSLAGNQFPSADIGVDFSSVYRFALTPPAIMGFDTMIGVYGLFGSHSVRGTGAGSASSPVDLTTNAHGADFQAQGRVTEGISLEVLGNILYDTGDSDELRNDFLAGTGADFQRFQFGFDVGLLNDRVIPKFNYLHSSARKAGAATSTARKSVDVVSLGISFNIRENVSLRPEISWVVGGDSVSGEPIAGQARNFITDDTSGRVLLFFAF